MNTDKGTLVAILAAVRKVVPCNGPAPWHTKVQVSGTGGRFLLEGRDLDTTVRVSFPARDSFAPQLVDLAALHTAVKSATRVKGYDNTVKLERTDDGWLAVWAYGRTTRLALSEVDMPEALPPLGDDLTTLTMPNNRMDAALSYAMLAASTDETRPMLHGAHVFKGRIVGTDGHRLHLTEGFDGWVNGNAILPAEAATVAYELSRLPYLSDETPALLRHSVKGGVFCIDFRTDSGVEVTIQARHAPYESPNFENVWALEHYHEATLVKEHLEQALNSTVRNVGKGAAARLTFTGTTLTVAARTDDGATEVADSMDTAGANLPPDTFVTGVNADLMLDALAGLPELTVSLRLGKDMAPVEVRQKGHRDIIRRAVVMPMRLEAGNVPTVDTAAAPEPAPAPAPVAEPAPAPEPAPAADLDEDAEVLARTSKPAGGKKRKKKAA